LLRHQLDNGASTNIILVAFSGLPQKQLADFNHRFTEKLNSSETFSRVTNNASSMGDELLEFLQTNRYLLTHSDLSRKFSVDGFAQSLSDRLEGLASSAAPIEKKFLRRDPTGEVLGLLEEWQGKISRHKTPNERHGVWFSGDRSRTLVLAEIAADISDMANQTAAVIEMRATYEQMKIPGIEVVMTGPAVFAVESGEDIRDDVSHLTLIAVSIVVLFLMAVYRSVRMMLLVLSPLVMGVVAATAVIVAVYNQIHGITLAFGITLAGVAVDYPIHLISALGETVDENNERIRKVWRTLRLGVFSTVVAYAAFLVSGFGGLQQLGLFTIIGLVTAALFSRWVLPYLAVTGKETMPGLPGMHNFLKRLGMGAVKLRFAVVAVLAVSLLALTVSNQPVLHLNVDSLSPITDDRRAQGKMLRDDLGFWYGGSMMLVTGQDKEQVLQNSEQAQGYLEGLVADGTIDGFDMAAHFLPSIARQRANLAALQNREEIRRNLEQALVGTPFRANVFDPFLDELESAGGLVPVDPTMIEKTAIGKKLEPLLFDFEEEAGGVILLHGVRDSSTMYQFAETHDYLYYMHLKTASTDLVARSIDRVSVSMIGCIAIIYLSLALAFKSIARPFKVMIPTFAAALGAAALLVFSGNPLSIFHLISLLLVVGLGLDYALFFNRLPGNSEEWDSTFKSLWVCGITTILVFGILTFSSTPPLKAIGVTVGLGAFLSMVFSAMWAATPHRPGRDLAG
jgi:predicted exporter